MSEFALHPILAQHGTFEGHVKLGRKPRDLSRKVLAFADYVDDDVLLPQIPDTFDLTLDVNVGVGGYPMDGNDQYGNCVCAAVAHLIQWWTAATDKLSVPTLAEVMGLYWATGTPPNQPCPPGGPTDDGRDIAAVLNFMRNTGLAGDKFGAFVFIDPTNHDHVRAALYLFGGTDAGVNLPVTAQSQQEWAVNGNPSDPNGPAYPGSWGGHSIPKLPRWDGSTLLVVTWGALLEATLGFNDVYFDEDYAVISNDWLKGGKTIEGFDAAQLAADLPQVTDSQIAGLRKPRAPKPHREPVPQPELASAAPAAFRRRLPSRPPVEADPYRLRRPRDERPGQSR